MPKAVVLLSGGMDSTTLAYWVAERGAELHFLSFDYGQRHRKEIEYALRTAARLGGFHDVIDLSSLGALLSTSALTGSEPVPEGHYSEESMKATVVPNRNAIMLSIATGIAVAREADAVYCAVHAGDHPIYPDCRPAFIRWFDEMERVATEGHSRPGFAVKAPFVFRTKADIAKIGEHLGVRWQDTWSCYQGAGIHCGRCGTCVERAEAFNLAGVDDPTSYADPSFWREAVAAAAE